VSDEVRLDEIDRRIIALLRANARRTFQDIGYQVSLSAPAVKRRVDRLEAEGVIRGYTAVVDPRRFGWMTLAVVELTTEGRFSRDQILEALRGHPEVVSAYTVAGAPSAILMIRTTDTAQLELVLERLRETPGITRTESAIVLSTLLERPFAPAEA
jgi:DNA-binding Lrp family transcriptional regulator